MDVFQTSIQVQSCLLLSTEYRREYRFLLNFSIARAPLRHVSSALSRSMISSTEMWRPGGFSAKNIAARGCGIFLPTLLAKFSIAIIASTFVDTVQQSIFLQCSTAKAMLHAIDFAVRNVVGISHTRRLYGLLLPRQSNSVSLQSCHSGS